MERGEGFDMIKMMVMTMMIIFDLKSPIALLFNMEVTAANVAKETLADIIKPAMYHQ